MGISISGELFEGIFKRRLNRFLAEIFVEGKIEYAHVPNTGRMQEFLINGAKTVVRRIESPSRKTKYDLLMVYYKDTLINIDSKLPNQILEYAFNKNEISPFNDYSNVFREVKYGNSRFDLLVNNGVDMAFIEAKCVTYVNSRVASFPDAPTERGRKHVNELVKAVKEGIRGAVFFIIQREDADYFTPNFERDPLFSKSVLDASKEGVEFYALNCKLTPRTIQLNETVPVILDY